MSLLLQYYENAYAVVRGAGFLGDIWLHDASAYMDAVWDDFMGPPQYNNVYLDTHVYQCFGSNTQQPMVCYCPDSSCSCFNRIFFSALGKCDVSLSGEL